MRTLYEIISDAKENKMPTHEECYYAMLVYEAMLNMDHKNLREVLLSEKFSSEPIRKFLAKNSHTMYKTALNKPPKEYLGWENDPANPSFQKRYQVSLRIFEKAMNGTLNKKEE